MGIGKNASLSCSSRRTSRNKAAIEQRKEWIEISRTLVDHHEAANTCTAVQLQSRERERGRGSELNDSRFLVIWRAESLQTS